MLKNILNLSLIIGIFISSTVAASSIKEVSKDENGAYWFTTLASDEKKPLTVEEIFLKKLGEHEKQQVSHALGIAPEDLEDFALWLVHGISMDREKPFHDDWLSSKILQEFKTVIDIETQNLLTIGIPKNISRYFGYRKNGALCRERLKEIDAAVPAAQYASELAYRKALDAYYDDRKITSIADSMSQRCLGKPNQFPVVKGNVAMAYEKSYRAIYAMLSDPRLMTKWFVELAKDVLMDRYKTNKFQGFHHITV
jgi:hypothetical protein